MTSLLVGLSRALAPGVIEQPSINDGFAGTEYRLGNWAAFRPSTYTWEPAVLVLAVAYVAWFYLGRAYNRSLATGWLKSVLPLLKTQFLVLSPNPEDASSGFSMVQDGGSTFLTYASGRRNVMSLHSTVDLIPRQDPLALLYKSFLYPLYDVTSPTPSDTVTLSLALLPPGSPVANNKSYSLHIPGAPASSGAGLPTGVWAVLQKSGMDRVRKARWDLSFPRVVPDAQSGVNAGLAVLAEHADVTKAVFNSGVGLKELLDDAEARKYFKNFVISDVPLVRPAKTLPFPSPLSLTLTLALPVPADIANAYLTVLLNVVDLLYPPPSASGKPSKGIELAPDVARKLKRTRVEAWEVVEKLRKEAEEEREKEETGKTKAERLEDERLRKKKEARDALSEKEKKKLDEREKKKAMIKQQKKLQKK